MQSSNAFLLNKIKSLLMKKGKSGDSEKLLLNTFRILYARGYSPLKVFTLAINNVKPLVELKKKKIRGTLQVIPRPIPVKSQLSKAIKLLINSSKKINKPFCSALADEVVESANRESHTFRESQTLHKLAVQSKSFAHYRWL